MIPTWRIFLVGRTNYKVRVRLPPRSSYHSTYLNSIASQKNAVNLPQDIPEEFDDEELAEYAEDFTQGELEEAVDDYFDLSDWDGLDDTDFASLENQAMRM